MFDADKECATCHFKKAARSKHCRVCNKCVSRFDHHCIWIKGCVGEKNYKWFLSFIASHSVLCLWGTYVGLMAFWGIIEENKLFEATFRNGLGESFKADWIIVGKYLFYKETYFIFIILLCLIMGFTLLLFLVYHF